MNTEQAHSSQATALLVGRDGVPPLPSRVGRPRIPRLRDAVPPITWLNLVCLDAPIVAISWLWLFARVFHVPVSLGNATALFLTAWLIYLADRVVDASALKSGPPRSLRQEFCLRHREVWIGALVTIGGVDGFVIWWSTAAVTLLAGVVVGLLALIYLVLNQPLGLIWRSLPAKEIAIGLLFAAGTLVALLPSIPSPPGFVFAAIGFAGLCSLNCISIACWERELDRAQGKVSIATRHPGITRYVRTLGLTLGLTAFALAIPFPLALPILLCIGVSALLLMGLDLSGPLETACPQAAGEKPCGKPPARWRAGSSAVDQRTALADLVLLTPLLALLAVKL